MPPLNPGDLEGHLGTGWVPGPCAARLGWGCASEDEPSRPQTSRPRHLPREAGSKFQRPHAGRDGRSVQLPADTDCAAELKRSRNLLLLPSLLHSLGTRSRERPDPGRLPLGSHFQGSAGRPRGDIGPAVHLLRAPLMNESRVHLRVARERVFLWTKGRWLL